MNRKRRAPKIPLPPPSLRRTVGTIRTPEQWRSDTNVVEWMVKMLAQPQAQEMLAILRDMRPLQQSRNASGVAASEGAAASLYWQQEGYDKFYANLVSLAEHANAMEDVEITFKDPNE